MRRNILLFIMVVVSTTNFLSRPKPPQPLRDVSTAIQDAVQQFKLEEETEEFTIEDLLDGGLEGDLLPDGSGCRIKDISFWLAKDGQTVFILRWRGAWYLLTVDGWRLFRIQGDCDIDKVLSFFKDGRVICLGEVRKW